MYGKGGSKPDYLDFDKDGNKKESMKSALKSKKKKGGAKMMYATGGEWILDPVPELFQDGGARAMRQEKRAKKRDERENKRAERKIGRLQKRTARQAERAGKRMAKNIQKGEDLEEKLATTPAERRAMKKSDRQANRDAKKADRQVRRSVRKSNRLNKRADRLNKKAAKLRGKAMPEVESKPVKQIDTAPVKNEPIKATPPAKKEMSFKDTFAAERKKQGPGGTFEWRGKKYTTDRADDKKKDSNMPKKKVKRGGMRYGY